MGLVTAITAAVAVGSALAKSNAAKKAAKGAAAAQNEALDQVKTVDVKTTQADAAAADRAKYAAGFSALAEQDPNTARAREASSAGLADSAGPNSNSTAATSLVSTLFSENVNQSPADRAFINTLKQQAQGQLDLGGALSPEQQSEFVRAGLENVGSAGVSAGSSAGKQSIGKLLASEQMAVQQKRQSMARELFGFASDLDSTRVNNLGQISSLATNTDQAQASKLLSIAQLADSRVPSIGLSGSDVANLSVANVNTQNQVALAKGGVKADEHKARGVSNAALIGGISSAVTSGIGSYGSYLKSK